MAEMIERIEKVLEQDVRPSLLSHEGNVQIVTYEEKSKILRPADGAMFRMSFGTAYNGRGN